MASPTAGERYSLACNVFGASTSNYQWRVNDSVIKDETSMILSWPMFHLSNAGVYSCNVTVDMMTYADNKTVTLKSNYSTIDQGNGCVCLCNDLIFLTQFHLQFP